MDGLWDAVSLGAGLASLGRNIEQGNWGAAAIDVLGIAVDGVALALPGIPGGAGMGLKALRGAGAATDALRGLDRLHTAHQVLNVAQTVDQAVGVGQGLYQAHQAIAAGQGGWGAFYLGLTSFSGLNLANKGARSLGYGWEFDSSRLGTAGGRVRLKRVNLTVGRGRIATEVGVRTSGQLIEDIATRASAWGQRKGLTGSARTIGMKQHGNAKRLLERYQRRFGDHGLVPERSFVRGVEVPYGTRGSTRLDVLDLKTRAVWDYKFGTTPMSAAQRARILTHGPGVTSITEIVRR